MARACTVCAFDAADAINAQIASGTALARIHALFSDSVSYAAIRRHAAAHHFLTVGVRDSSAVDPVTLTDLADRLSTALDDMDRLRVWALAANRHELAVKATAQSRAIIAAIRELGFEDLDALDALKDAETLGRAVGYAAQADASVGRAIAAKLRRVDPTTEMADHLDAVTVAAEQKRKEIAR